jgi:hypothetical protein
MTEGFCTPKEDKHPQRVSVPPKKVLPIIFFPGIMGSNLRISAQRQREIRKDNNIAWRPDRKKDAASMLNETPADRQLRLDPDQTEVDTYDDGMSPTGDSKETSAERHDNGKMKVSLHVAIDTPLLTDDPPTKQRGKTMEEKARERGWGEIFFSSYRGILEICETMLNQPGDGWSSVVDVPPTHWNAHHTPQLAPLTYPELREATKGCWFPVHAMGYNWLRSSSRAASELRPRIVNLISRYRLQGYQCEKVIIVTHSMGGLVARALIHPAMGDMAGSILGIVHGVMPATGAPAAYKRMRCGFEGGAFDIASKVIGNHGSEVTAVLANSPGALELLPAEAYGNGWLQIKRNGNTLLSLPKNGDPYEEIYKIHNRWYGLVREHWINPARQPLANFKRTCGYLDHAKRFHRDIVSTFHDTSFAHYGADPSRPSWQFVTWDIEADEPINGLDNLVVTDDDTQGTFKLRTPHVDMSGHYKNYRTKLGPCLGAGDQTVPLTSAEHQLQSGKFKGIFRQTGYEHQGSYSDSNAVNSTLFSLVRIIQTMAWRSK